MMPLKLAVRRLARAPGFFLLSVLMLALGIAMSTSAFSITNGMLLRPLPFPRPDELARVFTTSPRSTSWPLAPGNAMDVRNDLAAFGDFALVSFDQQNVAELGQLPRQQSGLSVSANFLRVLGIQPQLGRDFMADEDRPGKPPTVLLTDKFWRDQFGADPKVLGKVLHIEDTDCVVIGVLPPSFDEPLVWSGCRYVARLTVWPDWPAQRSTRWLHVFGRLRPGLSFGPVQARLDGLAARLAHDYPVEMGATGLRVTALGTSFVGSNARTIHWLVVGLAVLVLVTACANLGGVQLARTLGRRGELAIRAALGATSRDLMAVLAGESVVVAVIGTVLGVLLTAWARASVSHWFPGLNNPTDGRVLTFAALAGGLAVVFFGLLPAWLATRGSMAEAMKEAAPGATSGRAHQRFKYGLVICQLAFALVLVSAAASLVLGVRAFLERDRGWQPAGLVSGAITVPWRLMRNDEKNPTLARRLETDLRRLPGVESVAVASTVPLYGYQHPGPVVTEGDDAVPPGREPLAFVTGVDAGFFRVLGIGLVAGRLFPAEWRQTDPPVAVISASTARQLFPKGNALGKRIRFAPDRQWHEVIGVVADVSMTVGFDAPVTSLQVYRPVQEPFGPMYNFVLKTPLPAAALERQIRQAIGAIDPDMMVSQVGDVPRVLESYVGHSPVVPILVAFAVAGLSIAMIGLYGLMSQLAQQRRRDIGVRLALGADYRRIVGMMLAQGGRLLAVGVVAGLFGSFAVTLLLHRAMPGMPGLGFVVPGLIGIALGVAGLLAAYFPSHRAARLNPVEVLRAE